MDLAKIQLSEDELLLVQNAELLLTKNKIIDKVYHLFGGLAAEVDNMIKDQALPLPGETLTASPKISRGENYLGLPWVMLDFPRQFGKEDVFAIRVMFWWGHYFSITLHLKGKYQEHYSGMLKQNLSILAEKDFHVAIGTDEWRHEHADDNYVSLLKMEDLPTAAQLSANDFCKLSARISFREWNEVGALLLDLYRVIFRSLGH